MVMIATPKDTYNLPGVNKNKERPYIEVQVFMHVNNNIVNARMI